MPIIDNRLLDCNGEPELAENFNRTLALIDGGSYVELYLAANTAAVPIPSGATYTVYDTVSMTCDKRNGFSLETTEGVQSVKVSVGGLYYVNATFSSKLGTADVVWDTAVFVNGTEATNLHMRRRFSTAGYTFNVCLSGLLALAENDVLAIRVKHNNASAVSITTEYANISLHKIAEAQP